MNKISFVENIVKSITSKPKYGLRKEIYKKIIKPDEEKKDYNVKERLLIAGLAGLGTTVVTSGISKLLNKKSGNIPLSLIIPFSLSAATAGYFHPELRNATIDFHKNKDKEKLKEELKNVIFSEKNTYNKGTEILNSINKTGMLKQSGLLGNTVSTIGKTVWGGLKFGGNPTGGQKVTRFITKGVALGGLGYGGYKLHSSITRPRSTSNYTTFLRNNILSGNISGNEITENEKKQINELGMR